MAVSLDEILQVRDIWKSEYEEINSEVQAFNSGYIFKNDSST